MKFKHCSVQNFGSYKDFSIDFNNLGLVAVTGETGSGKSTILDMVPWILFGETSKDTKAEEVRMWGCDEPTEGTLHILLPDNTSIIVTRTRGASSENDLYFEVNGSSKIRGKSILETQKLLEAKLKVNADLYFTSAYLHQFSKADTFFIARSTDRREVFERIVDQSLAVELAGKIAELKKPLKAKLIQDETEAHFLSRTIEVNNTQLGVLKIKQADWTSLQVQQINRLCVLSIAFEDQRKSNIAKEQEMIEDILSQLGEEDPNIDKRITANHKMYFEVAAGLKVLKGQLQEIQKHGDMVCPECLQALPNEGKLNVSSLMQRINDLECILESETKIGLNLQKQKQLQDTLAKYRSDLERSHIQNNEYEPKIRQLETQENPHVSREHELQLETKKYREKHEILNKDIDSHKHDLFLLEMLQGLTLDLRGAILSSALSDLEKSTNEILSTYFDSEILIKFSLESSDKLELDIQKSGNPCSFRQLSGGQRCMLKLAFNLSLMALAENKAGVKFHTLMLDEPLTGLSDDLKIKAFSLFESLTKHYETIVVVEHSDPLKACFNNKIVVTMVGDESKADFG